MKPSIQENLVQKTRFIFLLSNLLLCTLWLLFAIRHIRAYFANPQIYILIFIVSETIVALLFLSRKKEKSISKFKFDWIISLAGTFLPLLFIPGGKIFNLNLGINLMTFGVMLQTVAALSLNRSLGIVPANRGIKKNGLYKIIRHPMYFSYFFTYTGYIIVSFSLFNFYLYIFTLLSIMVRIKIEEDFLSKSDTYKKYSSKVKYKLLPFIY